MKRLVLELGGHAPFLVFADADLDRAVAEAIKAKFATSGQDCLAANRFLIERPVYADFCRRFAAGRPPRSPSAPATPTPTSAR